MLIPVVAKCEHSGRPEPLLIPETSIIKVYVLPGKVAYRDGDKVRYADINANEVYRLKFERIPAPAGVVLNNRPVLYVELDPANHNATIASMADDGSVVLTDTGIRFEVPDEGYTDQAEEKAVEAVLAASEPTKKRSRKTASGSGAN